MSGRPLRFLALAAIGWAGVRAFMLWPQPLPVPVRFVAAPGLLAIGDLPTIALNPAVFEQTVVVPARPRTVASMPSAKTPPARSRRAPDPDRIALAMLGLMTPGPARYLDGGTPQLTPPVPGSRSKPKAGNRWSASAWLLLREGPSSGFGGQLGGGQGGVRIAYALGTSRRVALYGRVVAPVSGKGREAAFGVEWRPTRLPVRLVAEQRFSLDGGKSGPVVGIVGGTGPARVVAGFDLETYGQAGIIRRDRTEAFADGAARLTRRVAGLGKARVDLGLGAWGGAQRDAQRLDLGPTIGVRLPIVGKTIRVSADWRQRIAGRARPASGPALTIGGDF